MKFCRFTLESSPPATARYVWRCAGCDRTATSKRDKPPTKNCADPEIACRFKGEQIGTETCNICTKRGQKVPVFVCEIHGQCVKRQHRTPASMMDCLRCKGAELGYQPATFPRKTQSDCGLVAVTSLAPNDKARDALTSWQDAGLTVIALQPRDELTIVQQLYNDLVDEFVPTDQDARWQFGRKCVFIWQLAAEAIRRNCVVMVINSDIEIHGAQQQLLDAAGRAEAALVIGVRHNFTDWRKTSLERWGLDVFFVSPRFAASLPRLGLAMGIPLWDYWLPKHAMQADWPIEIIESPLWYHRSHPLNWTGHDWLKATRMLAAAGYDFGVTDYDDLQAAERLSGRFRESLRAEASG